MSKVAPASPEAIAQAADLLRAGALVVMPTETVYGLAADAANPQAVAAIFAAKARPHFNPLIAHVTGIDTAAHEARLSPAALALIERFWPGPLTIVAPRRPGGLACDLACAGLETIALRAPSHPAARALLAQFGGPLAAPSANKSGHVSPTTAAHAAEELGAEAALILDGGPAEHGLESTIVALVDDAPPTLLRPGAIPAEAIEAILGPLARAKPGDKTAAPGMLARHYAPRARVIVNAAAAPEGGVYLGFGPGGPAGALNLSPTGDLKEAAANLYLYLRRLDGEGARAIAIAPIPAAGLGEAINDRLRRAAARR